METTHQFIDHYPIDPNSKKLILGTIHPHNITDFMLPFFYGNKCTLWQILARAFPEELPEKLTIENIKTFLHNRRISVSDTVVKCKRLTNSALDKDLIPLELNNKLIQTINNSQIDEILFTSGFSKNNAFKLFYVDILKQKINKQIKQQREVIVGHPIFNRPIKLTVLYSPSGSANVPISKSTIYQQRKDAYINSKTPVQSFKIDYYREKFE